MSKFKVIAISVAALLILFVIAQNTEEVQTKILWMRIAMPRAVLLIVSLLVGFGLGVLFSSRQRRRTRS